MDTNNVLINQEDILKIIPHRDPFVFVNGILELEDVKIIGYYDATPDKDFFRGHFPETKVMPGVLIVEALAQTGAVLALQQPQFKGKIAYFAGIEKVRFKQKVVPGDRVILKVEIEKIRGPLGIANGFAYVNDKLCAQAKMTFMVDLSS